MTALRSAIHRRSAPGDSSPFSSRRFIAARLPAIHRRAARCCGIAECPVYPTDGYFDHVSPIAPIPRSYVCGHFAVDSVPFDGRLDQAPWSEVPWTEPFVDIEGDRQPLPALQTRAKFFWTNDGLYIGVEMEEPHLWATLTERDSVIFQDNDIEVFVDPDGDTQQYLELEMNALNTTWDLLLTRPYRAGGAAINSFDVKGLRTAVHLNGTLNDPSDRDHGWSVTIHLPWRSLEEIARVPVPPRPGDTWRINLSRVQWTTDIVDGKYVKRAGVPEHNWVWTPQHVIDMHRPEHWGFLCFADSPRAVPAPDLTDWSARAQLMRLFQAQVDYRGGHGHFARTLVELGGEFATSEIHLEVTTSMFEGSLAGWRVDSQSRLWSG